MTTKAMMPVPVSFLYMTRQGADVVELAGSFNDWTKIPVERGPWEWSLTLELPPGQYEYKFIVDGKWTHHQGKPTIRDSTGGLNNVVTVEKKQGPNSTVEFLSTGEAMVHRESRMGVYTKTDKVAQGRPVFQQAAKEEGEKQYFLYVGPGDCWRVGPDITSYSGSVIKHPKKNQSLPPKTGWNYYHEDKWNKDESLEATVKLRGSRDEKKFAFSKSQLASRKPSQDVKPALMIAVEADYKKLEERGKLEWLVEEQGVGLEEAKELLSQLDEDLNEELGMFGPPPLTLAATFGWEEVSKVLLKAGADVDVSQTSWGSRDSPLLAAASGGWTDLCQLFLSAGADINQRNLDGYGKTALDIAKESNLSEVVAVLEKHGAKTSELSLDQILKFHKISLDKINEVDEDTDMTPLTYAATIGHKDGCKILLDNGADMNQKEKLNGRTALLIAAEGRGTPDDKGEYGEICRMLIAAGADVNKITEYEETALHYAASNGSTDLCKMILEAGADINKQSDYGSTPLMKSLNEKPGHVNVAKMLISAGADVLKKDSSGRSALFFAASFGHTEIVKLILERDAKATATQSQDENGWTPLMKAAKGGYTEICKMLLNAGGREELDKQKDDGYTALMNAVHRGWAEVCDILLSAGADINKKNNNHYGDTAMDIAKEDNNTEVIAVLEKHGASKSVLKLADILKKHNISADCLDKEDEDGDTPLIYASRIRNAEACKLLLEAGADTNPNTEYGDTALTTAADEGYPDICKILIEAGADLNKENNYGWTPLVCAVNATYGYETRWEEVVKILLDAGADVNKRTEHGSSPLESAVSNNRLEMTEILIKNGADINSIGDDQTPLMIAAKGFKEICQLLIDEGAEIDKENKDGWTALSFAAINEEKSCGTMLLKAGANIEKVRKVSEKEEEQEHLITMVAGWDTK